MSISFNSIPNAIRTPGVYVEIDNSRAFQGLNVQLQRILVFGQRLSTGTVAAGVLTLVGSAAQGATFFGRGSMLANMLKALFDNGSFLPVYVIASDDNGAGVTAAGSFALSGTATANGVIYAYIGGKLITSKVLLGDTAAVAATNLAAAINANLDLPLTASATTGTVTVTARHKGINGNYIDLQVNFYGLPNGEQTPAGLTVVITAMASGAANPVLQTVIDPLPDDIFDHIVCPYDDATNLTALENELASRQSGTRMLEGHAFIAKRDTLGNLTTFSTGRNSPNFSCLSYEAGTPTTPHELASRVGFEVSLDPARPHTGLDLVGFIAPAPANRFSQTERNTLLYDGAATLTYSRDGRGFIERVTTMYQTTNLNTPDPSYLDVTTMYTNSFIRQDSRIYLSGKYQRMKIADDGTRITTGSNMTTPSLIKADIIGRSQLWEAAGLVEDVDQFAASLVVIRNLSDPTRVDIQTHPNLVNPLFILAMQQQFIL